MQAHQHEQNCLQIDPAMNRTIYSTPKLSWASDHERKFNFGRTSKSQWINQNQIRMMQAHQHEQNCLQIDPAMNRTIYSTPKLSWASDHERKFNLHKVLQLNFFFSSTGRRPPDRTGLSESEVTRLFNSNHEIFQWMLARYRFSNSRCALSDSSHLHLKPHVRFFTRDWFFSLMQHALLSAS